jgi:hypothetical protein
MHKFSILVAAVLLIASTIRSHAQKVSLGDAAFDATSDQMSKDWIFPMIPAVTNTFSGFGDYSGTTKTEEFSLGETVAGVKAVKRHIEGSSLLVPVEDWWLAAADNDDVRVLKLVRDGVAIFEASADTTPPLFLPGKPTGGQTWDLFEAKLTVEWFALSFSGERFKVKEISGLTSSYYYYHAGTGLTQSESDSFSGWRRVEPISTVPLPSVP